MSDPYDTAPAGTRFLMCGYDAHPKEFASGDWVRYSDYARLKAEVENANRINTELLVLSNRQASDIRRLTKAGDAMYKELLICGVSMEFMGGMTRGMVGWNSAKDGKPSA